ncbi:armadillo repeat-containing protein 3 [Leptonychotes weddellii]|uniref:Armadillo repeat-containing protein 3 n=1 Tax=Leptonychotes weddellii TaxID=9713 RepID=A0A7F8QFV0_LEPWE|nr:armadillo repeat-containing protein 3 [Leptonychotes weddellii]
MGKKIKKEAEPPPKDVFDPLMIESKEAATVVLMLNSPEEEILAKACEAIYRFALKGEENKATLLELGAVEPLTKLLTHENKIVRRNATMIFGILTSNNDVKKLLRELDVMNSVIAQLAPEEEVVIHEFASLCLANMSAEYTGKVQIFEHGGLEPLIRLLASPDPDVKKNSTECIYNLVQIVLVSIDFVLPIHDAAAEADGIDPLINMLSSKRDGAISNAATVLANMAMQEPLRVSIQNHDVMHALISPLRSANTIVQSKAALVVAATACDVEARTELRNSGGLEPLVELLRSKNAEVRRHASWAVMVCANDELMAVELCRLGALDILEEVNLSVSRKNKFSEAAYNKLLNNYLSLKYSLTGYLSSSNIISDGFYDYGQINPGTKLLPLKDLCLQEPSDLRAVLLVNSKSDVSPPPSMEDKSSDIGYGRSISSSSSLRRASKEKTKTNIFHFSTGFGSPTEDKSEPTSGRNTALSKSTTKEKRSSFIPSSGLCIISQDTDLIISFGSLEIE